MSLESCCRVPCLAALLAAALPSWATPPAIVAGTVNMFRDIRGANDVGITSGDRLQYGADIIGGSLDVTVGATAATGFVSAAAPCGPLTVNFRFCSNGTAYRASRLDPWQIHFTRGSETTTVTGPSMVGAPVVPFPTSVTLSGTGLQPTISWQLPAGYTPDAFRVNILDKSKVRTNGVADVISTNPLAANATSFQLPAGLSANGSYALSFQVIETRGHVAFTNNNAQIFSRSNSWFDFSPLSGDVAHDVALPTIDASGVYNFHVDSVGADHITFIDPAVAVGYHYGIGATGPNFQSVLLPNIGDGVYTLAYTDGSGAHSLSVLHDQQVFFSSGGVSNFTVTGIEASANLDPGNPTAFVTGLTFAGAGAFTGTMTALTLAVPEPQTYSLMLAGLGLLALRRRGPPRR